MTPVLARRPFLQACATLALPHLGAKTALAAEPTPAVGAGGGSKLVVVWLNGGPSHLDTFDPKPKAKEFGDQKAIPTALPGVFFAEPFPQLAALAQELTLVRSMSSGEGNHARAHYLMHTGYAPNPTVQHPGMAAWAVEALGASSEGLPPFVSLGGPSVGGGFLGVEYGPYVLTKAGDAPPDLASPASVEPRRLERRRMALSYLEKEFLASTVDPKVAGRGALYERAYRFMGSKDVRAFALEEESLAVRNAYGDTEFGRGCLVARRLLEAGVRCIEVVLDGWDTHQDNLVRTRKLGAALDSGLASLLKDLKERHLLDSTTVVCLGDFGRTPTINRNEGRDHHAKAWSALAAGGRLRRGHVHGETDATGTSVVRGKVTVPDFMATLFHSMGLPFDVTKTTPAGRPLAMTDGGVPVRELLADPG